MRNQFAQVAILFISVIALSCRGPEGPAGPQGENGSEALVDPRIQPKVIYTYPPMNSVGPYAELQYPQLQIRFNKMMIASSLRRAIHVEPSSEILVDTSYVFSPTGEFYVFNLFIRNYPYYAPQWTIGQTYTLTIDSTARDVNGNFVQPKFIMTFMPEPHFRVRSMTPPNTLYNSSPLSLEFNSPVDTGIFSAIHLSPPTVGGWILSYDSVHIFFLAPNGFKSSTRYDLAIDTSAHNKNGNHLLEPFVGQFTTEGFRVVQWYPYDGSQNVPTSTSISVYFNTAIDSQSLRHALSITPPTPGNIYVYSTQFGFYPITPLLPSTTYTLTIDTSLTAIDGSKLSSPFTLTFTTEAFRVYSNLDGASSINMFLGYGMYICANEYLDTSTVRGSMHIDPPFPSTLFLYPQNNCFLVQQTTNFAPNTRYTVTIDTTLRSVLQNHLTVPYTFSFTTNSFRVTWTSPADGATGINRSDVIFVYVTAKLDTASVRQAFSIDPPIAGYFATHDDGPNLAFSPIGGFPANTRYTVTISTDLEALGGYKLPSSYSFSFTTGN